jgi:thiaminase/transcriptional activator TenA
MTFYEEKLVPIIRRVCHMIEETPHMQDILNGTVPMERFQFQIKQNYQYLMDYTRCWAVGFSKCTCFEEMNDWYQIVKNTMEGTVQVNRDFWAEQIGVSLKELDAVIEAPGKRNYTSFQLMCAEQGNLAECMIALFPCNILYRFFGEDLLPKCRLPIDNMYYKWLEFYVGDSYIEKTDNEIRILNKLCENKSEREQSRLLEIFAISCNYEILQWQDMYYNMTTWPMDDIFPDKFTTIKG